MALEVNSQNLFQNAQFQQFVEFAEAAAAAGKQKAVARVDAGELGGIVNRTIRPGSGDWVGIGAGRLASLKKANNTTRDAFMKAVADMFGGEKLFNSMQDMPDGTRMYAEQKNIKGVDTFAQEFKIKGQCKADFYMDLQPSDEDLIEAQRQ